MDTPALLIRDASPTDAAALAALASRTFSDTFAADNDPADMAAYLASTYGPDLQAGEIADPAIATIVAERDDALVAFAQLRRGHVPTAVTGPAAIELWRFYVDRHQHGTGLAQRLMDAALRRAAAWGARTIWLGVWERNLRAQAFYRKCGFVDVGTHVFMLGRDRQTDRLMARAMAAGAARASSS